eukprot:gene10775-11928_t
MTTAARPTYVPARGGAGKGEGDLSVLSKQYSSRDLTSHTKLKTRQTGQDTVDEVRQRDFRRDLEERERLAVREKVKDKAPRSFTESSSLVSSSKRSRLEMLATDDEDDTAELLAELQKIKKERAEEQAKKAKYSLQLFSEAEVKAEEERIRTENIISGNPLLHRDFRIKRRWDDDVVFKNCSKDDDKQKSKGFINDTLRSDFHKRFMDKYVK